ncbi:hypothetical protein DH2020_029428 [Rehmannia glutinosa]|uniref:Uncharacterized protein n=1 Tax=Rehmannia glutinosa TaxID=99300 RepID=A0ABR0VQC8_REHGL
MEDDYYMSGGSEEEDDCLSSDRESESLDGLENEESDAQWGPSRAPSSKVITKESLLAAQVIKVYIFLDSLLIHLNTGSHREDLRRVMDLLSVKEHHARTLLIHYRWDVEKLISVYVEKGKSCMFSEAGVTVVELVDLDPPESSSTLMCNICMDDVPAKHLTKMDCGHCFCNNCWTEHFVVKINEGQSKRIRCMAHKCNAICDEDIIRKLVSVRHPDLAEKFDRFLLESYIEDNKMVKWCPSIPHCGNAIRVEDDEFCESFVYSYYSISCFSWLCGGATGRAHTWSHIANHSCGRYKEDTEKKAARAKRDLYRYMHYHNRYKAHIDSSKQESRLRETIKEKVSNLEARDSKLRDFSWVTNGLYRLFRSRRALSYSYPFAFYMFGDDLFKDEMTKKECEIKQHLFEDQQQQLESNVEKLSKFLEEPFDEYPEEQVMQIRMKVINLCVITDSLCKKMYECIENELLGSLQYTIHIIAPYQSKGIEKAEELTVGRSAHSNSTNKCQMATDRSTGKVVRKVPMLLQMFLISCVIKKSQDGPVG